jgi:hypothetical protein
MKLSECVPCDVWCTHLFHCALRVTSRACAVDSYRKTGASLIGRNDAWRRRRCGGWLVLWSRTVPSNVSNACNCKCLRRWKAANVDRFLPIVLVHLHVYFQVFEYIENLILRVYQCSAVKKSKYVIFARRKTCWTCTRAFQWTPHGTLSLRLKSRYLCRCFQLKLITTRFRWHNSECSREWIVARGCMREFDAWCRRLTTVTVECVQVFTFIRFGVYFNSRST